jgi:predicted transposase YdaD
MAEAKSEAREEEIKYGIAIGEERGISIGLSQGAHQKAVETAKVLKAAGVEINLIIDSTGLSVEEIEKL